MKRFVAASVLVLLVGLLTGCNLVMLHPKGVIAAQEKQIIIFSAALMLLVVIPVIVLAIVFAWRYRESNAKQATYAPEWSHSTLLEVIWWSIPCLIIAVLATMTWITSHTLDPYRPIQVQNKTPLTIQVIALEWKWLFIYPEQNIATVNYVQFPVNTPIKFLVTAEGPMNSFQIPQLGGQIYAMAGMQSKLHLLANKIGDYRGIAASFSGEGFSGMKFNAHVGNDAEFNEWVKTVKSSPAVLSKLAYKNLIKPSENNTIEYFSSVYPDLFKNAMMKSMMPMND